MKNRASKTLIFLSVICAAISAGFFAVWAKMASYEPPEEFIPEEVAFVGVIDAPIQELPDPDPDTGEVPDELAIPAITLKGAGGQAALDRCTGSFVEMVDYASVEGLQTTYAAHNNCGGEVILDLDPGDRITVNGMDYFVQDMKNVKKAGGKAQDLLGMNGEIILQSCYWYSQYMKFIAVSPVP